jgi:hypothetical protein
MSRTTESYRPEVFKLLAKIGEVVGTPVGLFRYHMSGKYEQLTPETDLSVFAPIANGASAGYSYFVIASKKQDSLDNITNFITAFNINSFPGCCAFCVSHSASVRANYRRKGVNTLAVQLRAAIAGLTGYTGLVCTDITSSIYSLRCLERAGFKVIHEAVNKRTRNTVKVYVKELE